MLLKIGATIIIKWIKLDEYELSESNTKSMIQNSKIFMSFEIN